MDRRCGDEMIWGYDGIDVVVVYVVCRCEPITGNSIHRRNCIDIINTYILNCFVFTVVLVMFVEPRVGDTARLICGFVW